MTRPRELESERLESVETKTFGPDLINVIDRDKNGVTHQAGSL